MKLIDLLKPGPPAVARCIAEENAMYTALWTLRGEDDAAGLFIGTLRGKRMRRREGLFDQFGALLQFPTYFGENWDAFNDCMGDLQWLRAGGFVLVVLDAEELLADADENDFRIFLEILADIGDSCAEPDSEIPFHVVLQTAAAQASALQGRLAAFGREIPLLEM